MRELTDNECDAIIDDAMENSGSGFVRIAYAYVRAGHAAGYRAAQAARPPREPTQAMMVGSDFVYNDRTTRLNIWRAMHDAWTQEQTSGGTQQRAERAEAERDALRAVVRAADYMRTREEHSGSSPGCVSCAAIAVYDAARAKVNGTI